MYHDEENMPDDANELRGQDYNQAVTWFPPSPDRGATPEDNMSTSAEITGKASDVFNLTIYRNGFSCTESMDVPVSEIGDGCERLVVKSEALDQIVSFEPNNKDAEREAYDIWCASSRI